MSQQTNSVLDEVYTERVRQDHKWGEQNHPDAHPTSPLGSLRYKMLEAATKYSCDMDAKEGTTNWNTILFEEVMEASATSSEDDLRKELIQVAAVAVNWIECIDRRRKNGKH